MQAIFLDRNRVITDASTDYELVILDGVDEFQEPVRNPNLVSQLNAVKSWGVPVLLRIVSNAQWYSDEVTSIANKDDWAYVLNKYTVDATSAMIGVAKTNGTPVDGLILTAWKDEAKGTTSAWVSLTMQYLLEKVKASTWRLPVWMEFPYVIDVMWDKGQLVTYGNNLGEYAVRPTDNPTMKSVEILLPDNALTYFPEIPEPDIPIPEPEPYDEDAYIAALMSLPDILAEAKRTNVLLESIYKLVEAYAPWRKQ